MAKPNAPETGLPSPSQEVTYGSGMRILGGLMWATLLTALIGSTLIVIPQFPRPWLWGIPPIWLVLAVTGILLQWSVARGNCPKCGYQLTVPPMGARCPQCRTYLKAVDRKIMRA